MPLETSPYGPELEVHWGSDITSVRFDGTLVILVARMPLAGGRFEGLRITFGTAYGFRFLDELDLARYWSATGFTRAHHVLSVKAGGWSSEENHLQGYDRQRREWLVITGSGCLSVFSGDEPKIEQGEFDGEA